MSRKRNTQQADIYEKITNQIIEAMENGAGEYRMPWHRTGTSVTCPRNIQSQNPYRGVNQLVLWAIADKLNYQNGLWGTYQQWQALGAKVRKGEKAAPVVYWGVRESENETDVDEGKTKIFARGYSVFNIEQVEGYTPEAIPQLSESERIENADGLFSSLGADIRHGGEQAYYSPKEDYIQMPVFNRFKSSAGYYSVLAHETIHWTGNETRLSRELSTRFKSDAYAMEELVAELGAAFLCGHLEIGIEARTDHAAYLSNWLEVLKTDKRAIFTAASKAQQAVDYLITSSNEIEAAA